MRLALEGFLEKLETSGDLLRRIDVERGAMIGSKSGEIGSIAVERAVAIEEGARAWLRRDFFGQTRCSLSEVRKGLRE